MSDLDTWAKASEMVADALDGGVSFEWPGTINVLVTPSVELVYGAVNDTINANISVLNGDMWDYWEPDDGYPESLVTDVPSSSRDAQQIAEAIIASVRAWSAESIRP